MALKQNNLAEATTEQGFPTETSIPLQREVEVDGTTVTVEGVTPAKIAADLGITYKTPGEPYVNGEVQLNGVVQTYNEGSEPKFDDIVLGGSYKIKLKEKLDLIDNMSTEELVEFFNDKDNKVAIADVESSSPNGNNIITSFIEKQNMPVITASFIRDSKQYHLVYAFSDLAQKRVWCVIKEDSSIEPATPDLLNEYTIENIKTLMNNFTGDVSKPGDEISEYGSLKLNWLLDSVESIS